MLLAWLMSAALAAAPVTAAPQKKAAAKKPATSASKPRPKMAPKKKTGLPALLDELEAKYSEAETLVAKFSQVNEIAALKQKKTSNGLLMVKRPDKVRWETLKPDPNLLVSDCRTFWFYTPPFDEEERGQVIERKTTEIQSRMANALLAGSFSKMKDMKIRAKGRNRYVLSPKPGSAGTVVKAEVQVNPTAKLIEKVILEHKGGNRSEIALTEIELGKSLEEGLFSFTPPPNTDKVDD